MGETKSWLRRRCAEALKELRPRNSKVHMFFGAQVLARVKHTDPRNKICDDLYFMESRCGKTYFSLEARNTTVN
ncbi:hypothetical protein MLD38_035296 [Melastoma candidum]|uniref:Uncharacterized protein n=1 Tax=Melastoma candidum TaxID=119954 RepID=A0ACB9MD89_9MYRT|nr:hypothetical protein MLD38_035296 [Melastoma candidum]